MGMFDGIAGFGVTFSTMFKKVVTEEYPLVKKVTAPRYHGRHQLNRHPDGLEKCVGCELCAWACPADAIYVEGGDNTETERFSPGERYGAIYQINYLRCIFCGLCIEACPTRALTMSNEYELADDRPRGPHLHQGPCCMTPLLPGMEQPPHPMRLGDEREGRTTCRVPSSRARAGTRQARPTWTPTTGQARTSSRVRRSSARASWPRGGPPRRAERRGSGPHDHLDPRGLFAFWILAPMALVGAALGMVLARSARPRCAATRWCCRCCALAALLHRRAVGAVPGLSSRSWSTPARSSCSSCSCSC